MDKGSKVEITLTREEAAAARRLLSRLVASAARDQADLVHVELAARIDEALRERRHFFPADLFSDPGWDMVLSLYCADGRGERLGVTALGHSVGLPLTTALRWIDSLSRAGLIEREADEHDRRRSFLNLTDPAREKIRQWLERVAPLMRSDSPL